VSDSKEDLVFLRHTEESVEKTLIYLKGKTEVIYFIGSNCKQAFPVPVIEFGKRCLITFFEQCQYLLITVCGVIVQRLQQLMVQSYKGKGKKLSQAGS